MITAIILATVILTLVLSIWLRYSKGQIGEKRVARILGRLPKDRYLVINNMILRTASGGTTFMDIILLIIHVFKIITLVKCTLFLG